MTGMPYYANLQQFKLHGPKHIRYASIDPLGRMMQVLQTGGRGERAVYLQMTGYRIELSNSGGSTFSSGKPEDSRKKGQKTGLSNSGNLAGDALKRVKWLLER